MGLNLNKYVVAFLLLLSLFFASSCHPLETDVISPLQETDIISVTHYMNFQNSVSSTSRQGCAVYGDYLFVFHNTNDVIEVYSISQKKLNQIIRLAGSDLFNSEYHCNNANFGQVKFSSDDFFPLLYVSMEHIKQHCILVLRIKDNESGLGVELIQKIELPKPEVSSMYYPNSYIDIVENSLWVSGYTNNNYNAYDDNHLRYVKYNLPTISSGSLIKLQESDLVQSAFFKSISSTQGGVIINGMLHQVFGIYSPRYYVVYDLKELQIIFKKELYLVDCEPEGLFMWNNSIYYTSESSVYEIQFNNSELFN